jgi:hypothetical protein
VSLSETAVDISDYEFVDVGQERPTADQDPPTLIKVTGIIAMAMFDTITQPLAKYSSYNQLVGMFDKVNFGEKDDLDLGWRCRSCFCAPYGEVLNRVKGRFVR